MRRKLQLFTLVASIAVALALLPAAAEAQRGGRAGGRPGGGAPPAAGRPQGGHPGGYPGGRPGGAYPGGHPGGYYGRPGGGTVVVRGGYYAYPYWGVGFGWGPYWGSYWYGSPYWGYPYPYWDGGYYDNGADLRLEVKPKQAQVYVDGYYAGLVDDFDGTFQRLRLRPGEHELVLFLDGYKTVSQTIRLGQRQEATIKYEMTPLAAGETAEPPPQPKAAPPDEGYADNPPAEPRGQAPRPAQVRPAPPAGAVEAAAEPGQGFGSLVIRVQPSGSEVLIDGERWQGPEGPERLVVQVPAGTHKVEVRKEGTVPFSTTIRVRPGETVPLNVSLPPRGE
jgi:hypothetical protein